MSSGAPDHFKRILLYGLYDGEATPLACDEQGRLILVTEPVAPYDRAGTIILHERFGAGLAHVKTWGSGTGYSIAVESDEVFAGGHSCKLTGGSTSAKRATIDLYFYPSAFTKFGFQMTIRWGTQVDYVLWLLTLYSGEYLHQFQLKHDKTSKVWQIYDFATSSWETIASQDPYPEARNWVTVKLVIDCEAGVYHRFRYGYAEADLTGYSINKIASTAMNRGVLEVSCFSNDGQNGFIIVDDIIITQDES